MRTWGGRKVQQLVALVLELKGRTCHLCGLGGADSADHDPPRSVLVASGCPDPDALEYLHPAHRVPCNVRRQARPITQALRDELHAARLAHLGRRPSSTLSPRFARRRPDFLRATTYGEGPSSPSIPGGPEKNRRSR